MSIEPTTPARRVADSSLFEQLRQRMPRLHVPGSRRVVNTPGGTVVLLLRPDRGRRPDATTAGAGEERR